MQVRRPLFGIILTKNESLYWQSSDGPPMAMATTKWLRGCGDCVMGNLVGAEGLVAVAHYSGLPLTKSVSRSNF